MWNIFGPSKNSSEVIEKIAAAKLFGLSSIFFWLFYFIHILAARSYQSISIVFLFNGVSTGSRKRTSVLQIRQNFSPIRIHVGLASSYGKLRLSLWKIYMCNLMRSISTHSGDSYGQKLYSAHCRLIFYCYVKILCQTSRNPNGLTSYHTSGVAVVIPIDRPKSVRNRCVIEYFGGVSVLSHCFWDFWIWIVGAFVIGLSQISSFFS